MTDSRYAGSMPDSMFKTLTEAEEAEFRQWAHDNYSLTLPEGFSSFHPVIRDEWRKIESAPESYSVSLADVCLPCYLQDHHNREGEQLLCVPVDGSTRNSRVLQELLAELQNYEYPEGFNYGAAEQAIRDCIGDKRKLFDSSLERGESDESCYAYFVLSYTIGTNNVPNLDHMESNELRKWAQQRAAKSLFPDKPKGFIRATRDLANYAHNKATAIECRSRGDIQGALMYENICQRIYDKLPPYARW